MRGCGSKLQTAGLVPTKKEIHKLVLWLGTKADHLIATDSLSAHLPPATEFSRQASGLLSILIPSEHPIRLIWFRAEQVLEVEWAGNPHTKAPEDAYVLSPRKSFDVWRQRVRHHSRKWTDAETDSAQLFAARATAILQGQSIRRLNSALQRMNAELSVEAATDPLTGLANRRAFDKCIREQWELAKTHRHHLSLITCDVDFFKTYNDCFGHAAGDACLKEVARILTDRRRSSDMAARVGGEEFCLLLPHTNLDDALKVAEHIRRKIEMLAIKNPGSPLKYVTISLGVGANDRDNVANELDLIEATDAALYQAKNGGRNRVVGSVKQSIDDGQESLASGTGAAPEDAA
jgi:diguanylate cyclase (GGDEF)-like protein